MSGSAPLQSHVMEWFKAVLGAHIIEGYGQTETTATTSIYLYGDTHTGITSIYLDGGIFTGYGTRNSSRGIKLLHYQEKECKLKLMNVFSYQVSWVSPPLITWTPRSRGCALARVGDQANRCTWYGLSRVRKQGGGVRAGSWGIQGLLYRCFLKI